MEGRYIVETERGGDRFQGRRGVAEESLRACAADYVTNIAKRATFGAQRVLERTRGHREVTRHALDAHRQPGVESMGDCTTGALADGLPCVAATEQRIDLALEDAQEARVGVHVRQREPGRGKVDDSAWCREAWRDTEERLERHVT